MSEPKKDEVWIDQFTGGAWVTITDPQKYWKNKEAGAKRINTMLDIDPDLVLRLRNYWGNVLWSNADKGGF